MVVVLTPSIRNLSLTGVDRRAIRGARCCERNHIRLG